MDTETLEGRRRRAVRHFASGVAVLTVVDDSGTPHGTTVSAVTAISREPLLLGVCLRLNSAFARRVRDGGRFTVNVLRSDQYATARWFADPARPAGTAQFRDVAWETDALTGAPTLTGSLATLGCQLVERLALGDHDLLVAQVLAGSASWGSPLLSYAGRLHDGDLHSMAPDSSELTVRSSR
ncbi:flavin reductase family protein [Actinoplanes teichomyceticus]|uniref:Flavin reductase (DIM6/NTAB) family NADH-FMN oxidoreductase RutF n=1 Tax=Actinoplanes teichomyceticus TaxID=1867 RepID=A0A561WLP1_ACTTI|nr:flavin reductase family protein [Actinoplanes teichomyceticus]TWG24788.1 flavin reductase (DIM6/NTAB) family NADH-FMN oxidoreductase RutF [Actinoplanes teichomyceticus]GIF14550.1 flavin reductase [Actinoplanes teichomyceticus]